MKKTTKIVKDTKTEITPTELEKLALEIASDWGGGIAFKDYLDYIKTDREVKFLRCKDGCPSYYNPETQTIVIGYTDDEVKAFLKRLSSNKGLVKPHNKSELYYNPRTNTMIVGHIRGDVKKAIIAFCKETTMIPDNFFIQKADTYCKNMCVIHEYTHKYITDLINNYGNKEATLLECYLMYAASQSPIDAELFNTMKNTVDPRVIDLLDALSACPVNIRENGYYDKPNHPRLQEALANWAELTYAYPNMSMLERNALVNFIPKAVATCLNRIFRLRSLVQ